MKNSTLYKLLGWTSLSIVVALIIITIVANATGDVMPYYLKWRALIAVPFGLFYGLRQLRNARYYEILELSNIKEM